MLSDNYHNYNDVMMAMVTMMVNDNNDELLILISHQTHDHTHSGLVTSNTGHSSLWNMNRLKTQSVDVPKLGSPDLPKK